MPNTENKNLFLVVIGGRANKANVELHDVWWVIGTRIEDTFMSYQEIGLFALMGYILIAIKKNFCRWI